MKKCSHCKEHKELIKFSKNKARYDGFCNLCKKCEGNAKKTRMATPEGKAVRKKWEENHKEQRVAYNAEYMPKYYREHKGDYRRRSDRWNKDNHERAKELWRNYYHTPKGKAQHAANESRRRARKLMGAYGFIHLKAEIDKIYQNRPEGYHVDHIIPLRGKNVCGLHVPWNLQYLPAAENIKKNNRVILEDMITRPKDENK